MSQHSEAGPVTDKLLIVLITLIATTGYLGLAIWGGGGFTAFFSEPARIALTVVIFTLGVAALFSQGHLGAGEREDRGNRWVIAVFGVVGLLLGYLPAYTLTRRRRIDVDRSKDRAQARMIPITSIPNAAVTT